MNNKIFADDRCYRPDEVARILHISIRTVYRLVDEEVESIKLKRSIRISGRVLNQYLDNQNNKRNLCIN